MEEALKQGEESLKDFESSNKDNKKGKVKSISEAELPEFEESRFSGNDSMEKLNFLKDLQLSIYIELGRTQMQIKEILELERGYVIELDKLASEPAEGEVVVIDKHFGIRIVNLVDVSSRMKAI